MANAAAHWNEEYRTGLEQVDRCFRLRKGVGRVRLAPKGKAFESASTRLLAADGHGKVFWVRHERGGIGIMAVMNPLGIDLDQYKAGRTA
jgi:hypothetical protein